MLQVSRKQPKEAAATVEQIRGRSRPTAPSCSGRRPSPRGQPERADACYREALRRWPDDSRCAARRPISSSRPAARPTPRPCCGKSWQVDPALGWAAEAGPAPGRAARRPRRLGRGARPGRPTARPDDTPEDRLARATVYARGPGQAPAAGDRDPRGTGLRAPGAAAVHDAAGPPPPRRRPGSTARQHAAEAAGEGRRPGRHPALRQHPARREGDLDGPSGSSTGWSRSTRTASPWPRCEPGSWRPGAGQEAAATLERLRRPGRGAGGPGRR